MPAPTIAISNCFGGMRFRKMVARALARSECVDCHILTVKSTVDYSAPYTVFKAFMDGRTSAAGVTGCLRLACSCLIRTCASFKTTPFFRA